MMCIASATCMLVRALRWQCIYMSMQCCKQNGMSISNSADFALLYLAPPKLRSPRDTKMRPQRRIRNASLLLRTLSKTTPSICSLAHFVASVTSPLCCVARRICSGIRSQSCFKPSLEAPLIQRTAVVISRPAFSPSLLVPRWQLPRPPPPQLRRLQQQRRPPWRPWAARILKRIALPS